MSELESEVQRCAAAWPDWTWAVEEPGLGKSFLPPYILGTRDGARLHLERAGPGDQWHGVFEAKAAGGGLRIWAFGPDPAVVLVQLEFWAALGPELTASGEVEADE